MVRDRLVLVLILLSALSGSLGLVAPESSPIRPEENLSYECARQVATIIRGDRQAGPVFSEGQLVFTSIEARGGAKVLIVSAGSGTYAVNLPASGVNRLRFEVPLGASPGGRTFFISYVHDSLLHSRYFDLSEGKPPAGREESDFHWAPALRAGYMLPNLEYAIYETSENLLSAVLEGRVSRTQMERKRKGGACAHLSQSAPGVARTLLHNLDVLELIVMGPATGTSSALRLPAGESQ